jgi:hypothetical protein
MNTGDKDLKLILDDINRIIDTINKADGDEVKKKILDFIFDYYFESKVKTQQQEPRKPSSNKHNANNQAADEKKTTPAKRNSSKKPKYELIDSFVVSNENVAWFKERFELTRSSAKKQVVLAVYLLEMIMKVKEITLNHIYTIFKHTKNPLPKDLPRTILNASSTDYPWIIANRNKDIQVSSIGETLVESELDPKKGTS